MVEDGGAVLVPVVAELPILLRRVDVMPEHVEELFVTHLFWIIDYLDRFRMAGAAGRHLVVGRIFLVPASIARGGGDHAGELVKWRLHAPEAAAGKGGLRRARAAGRRLLLGIREPRRSQESEHGKKADHTLDLEPRHAFLLGIALSPHALRATSDVHRGLYIRHLWGRDKMKIQGMPTTPAATIVSVSGSPV